MATNFPGGFPGGLNVRNVPILNSYSGKVYWVHYTDGVDATNDGTFDRPWKTLDYASSKCTANDGDIIVLKAGHSETTTTATSCNLGVAGVSVIGLGTGANKATITSGTNAAAIVTVDAANVSIDNVRFVCGKDAQTIMMDINAKATVTNCEFLGTASAQPVLMMDIGGTTASSNETVIQNCHFESISAGAVKGIWISTAQNGVIIQDNDFIGNFSSACVGEAITVSNTNLIIRRNTVHNVNAASQGLVMFSATGIFVDNQVYNVGGVATAVAGGSMAFHENYATSALAVAALLVKDGAFA